MSEPFTHHTFTPIRTDGERRIVAAEAEWAKVQMLHWRCLRDGRKRRVEIGGDLFEPWTGGICDAKGVFQSHTEGACEIQLTIADVRRRVFRLIDDCPHIDFLLNTTRLAEAEKLIPEYGSYSPAFVANGEIIGPDFTPDVRPNLILGMTVSTQREVDEWLPLLLRLQAAVRWVRYVPGEGLDFLRWFGPQNEGQWMNVVECGHRNQDYGVNWLTIAGSLDSPTNLDHVRDVIAQGRAAGVPVCVEWMGAYLVMDGSGSERFKWPGFVVGEKQTRLLLNDPHGADPAEWPEDLRVREAPR